MARQDNVRLILIICVLIVLLIAVATKAAHWDKIVYKNTAKDHLDEVYPGLEGCIAVDAILMFFFILLIIFGLVDSLRKFTKYLLILIIVVLCIRLVLALLFLAGNDNYCKKLIDYCNDQPGSYCSGGRCYVTYCGDSVFSTLKGAWIFEIIAIILVNIFAIIILVMMFKGTS